MVKRSFASDNNAPIHPEILQAIQEANQGHVLGYGDDLYTSRAIDQFKKHFGNGIDVYFVFNGTGANVLGLSSVTRPFNAVFCAETAHIQVDECGAPERLMGCKLITLPINDEGKITVEVLEKHYRGIDDPHHVQPKVISISQTTELGTVYSLTEIRKIADFAHARGMFLHMDGARLANAAVSLACDFKALTYSAGVDILSFGGTKNGLMLGEAVVFFNHDPTALISRDVKFLRKQSMQLASKMRFISAQFEALLSADLWKKNALQANQMAKLLAARVQSIPRLKLTRKVQANAVFAAVPKASIANLQKEFFFYVWNPDYSATESEVRWMCSFDTTEIDVENFVQSLKRELYL